MAQKQAQRNKTDEEVTDVEPREIETSAQIDAILDDIDTVLEENAAEFVRSYIQAGGQ